MARKTAAQQREEQALRAQEREAQRVTYSLNFWHEELPKLLDKALEHGYEAKITKENHGWKKRPSVVVTFGEEYEEDGKHVICDDEEDQWEVIVLWEHFGKLDEAKARRLREEEIRKAAIAKLTEEERKVLRL